MSENQFDEWVAKQREAHLLYAARCRRWEKVYRFVAHFSLFMVGWCAVQVAMQYVLGSLGLVVVNAVCVVVNVACVFKLHRMANAERCDEKRSLANAEHPWWSEE